MRSIFSLAFLCLPVVAWSQAGLVDFESMAEGQPVAAQVNGITFTNATVLQAAASLNEVEYPPHSGSKVACDVGGPMTINFTTPVGSITGFFTHQKSITIQGIGVLGNALEKVSSSASILSSSESLTANFSGPTSKIIITSDPGGSSFTVDDLSFSNYNFPPPSFNVDYTHLGFEAVIGRAAPPPQVITLTADPVDVTFSITSSATWLKASPLSGKTTANVSVFVDPTGLAPASYVGLLLINGGKNGTAVIQVVLRVLDRPQLTATPTSMNFTWKVGAALPAAQKLYVGALNANVDYFTMTKDAWVKTNPTFATTGLAGYSLAVTVDPSKLAPGHYDSAVYVYATEATNSPLTIAIHLDVTQ